VVVVRAASLAIVLSLAAWSVWAAPQVVLKADRTTVAVGEPFRVSIEASGTRIGTILTPQVPGLLMESRSTQEQMQIINFEMTRSRTISYDVTATQPGAIDIPAVKVEIDGRTVSSQPLTITVEKGRQPAIQPRQADQPRPAGGDPHQPPRIPKSTGPVWEDLVTISTSIDKTEVYQGEPIVLTFNLWELQPASVVIGRQSGSVGVDTTGFYAIPEMPQEVRPVVQTFAGNEYTTREWRQVLHPTRPGDLQIGAWTMDVVVRVPTRGFFGEQHRLHLTADPIAVKVKPLPERPENFSGAVGRLTVTGELSETKVIQGTPANLAIRIAGEGNPDAVGSPAAPDLEDAYVAPPEVESRPPVLTETGGVAFDRTVTFAITPVKPGQLTIPAITYCYFDPAKAKYETASVGPFRLEVLESPEQEARFVSDDGLERQKERVDVLGLDVLPIITDPGTLRREQSSPALVVVLVAAPALACLAFSFVMRRRQRFEQDMGYARAYHARSKARKRLETVSEAARPVDELYHALTGFIADKLDIPEAGLTSADVARHFADHGLGEDKAENLARILRSCERAQYGAARLSPSEIGALVQGAALCMDELEDALRKERRA
jgi:BatD DUF11 like domain